MTALRAEDIPIPPELALAQEPDVTPVLCDRCEDKPAEYIDDGNNYLCAPCVDGDPQALGLKRYQPWSIGSTEEAEWALRKLIQARTRIAEVEDQAHAFIERIKSWSTEQLSQHLRDEMFFQFHLEEFARAKREADPKLKTLRLPSGSISSRSVGPRPVVTDEAALVEFMKDFCAEMGLPPETYLRVKVEPKLAEVRKILAPEGLEKGMAVVTHGEQVPGLEIEPGKTTFSVKVDL